MSLIPTRWRTPAPALRLLVHRVSWEGRLGQPGGNADCATTEDAEMVRDGLLKLGLAAVVWEVGEVAS